MLAALWNFNETFRKDVTYDNIKSHQKPGFTLSEDKGGGESNLSPLPPMLFQRFLFEVSATLKQKLSSKVFCKKDVRKKFAKFTGKHLYISIILNKVAGLQPVTSLIQRLRYKSFPVNFAKFLRTSVLQHICERQLLRQGFIHILKILQWKTKTHHKQHLPE